MKCKCVETDHSHQGYCNSEITFADSAPMNDYNEERCCNDCYDKIKNDAISQFEKHKPEKVTMDKEIKDHPLGAGFISKDMKLKLKKATQGCEICGECVKSKRRNDGIHVCDACSDKYPIKD